MAEQTRGNEAQASRRASWNRGPRLGDRTWVLLTEAPDGGWGIWGRAYTNANLVTAARAQLAELTGRPAGA
jgi:hypothetical protein